LIGGVSMVFADAVVIISWLVGILMIIAYLWFFWMMLGWLR